MPPGWRAWDFSFDEKQATRTLSPAVLNLVRPLSGDAQVPLQSLDISTIILSVLYVLAMLAFLVLFIVDWALHFRQTGRFWKYGFVLGGVMLAMDAGILVLLPTLRKGWMGALVVVTDIFSFGRVALFTVVGMYCCMRMRRPDLPLLGRLWGRRYYQGRINSLHALIAVAVVAGMAAAYSGALFKLASPQMSSILKELTGRQRAAGTSGDRPSLLVALVLLTFALAEEVTFRLGIQSFLARQLKLTGPKYALAVLATSALWTMAHTGTLNPEWVKFAQIFPLGLALGCLCWKYGAEAAILAHGGFNIIMMFLGPLVIRA